MEMTVLGGKAGNPDIEIGIKAVHSAVHHPQTLGKVERFNRTFQENAWFFPSAQAFIRYYNFEHKHASLGRKSPAECYFPKNDLKRSQTISSLGDVVTQLG